MLERLGARSCNFWDHCKFLTQNMGVQSPIVALKLFLTEDF